MRPALPFGAHGEHPARSGRRADGGSSGPVLRREAVLAVRREFEALNAEVIGKVLKGKKLRGTLTEEEVRELFRMLQGMWNSEGLLRPADTGEAERRERICREMIGVFFYGVLERESETKC